MKKYIEAGEITSTRGIKGELRVKPLCDSAEFMLGIKRFWLDGRPVAPSSRRVHKAMLLMTLPGIETVEAAIPLVGKTLYMDRGDVALPPGTYFICDLVGLEVYDTRTEKILGRISEVLTPPANDVYVVTGEFGELMIPAAPGFIEDVDLDAGRMTVNTIKGMAGDDD